MDIIYKIQSPKGKVYIGRTNDFERRMAEHKYSAFTRKSSNSLYKAIRKYGWDCMVKEIICEVESEKAQKIEEELIIAHNSVKKGYNDSYKGAGGDQWKDRRDTIEYMEWIEKMKKVTAGKNNGMFGKTHKTSTTNIMKQKAKGRFSLEWFIDRNGKEEGLRLWEERREFLRNRNLPKGDGGKFISNITH